MKKILLFICTLFIGLITVNAADLSNVKLTLDGITEDNQTGAFVKISGGDFDADKYYYGLITKDTSNIPTVIDTTTETPEYFGGLQSTVLADQTSVENSKVSYLDYHKAAERFGSVYVTIYESESSTKYNKVSSPIMVAYPEQLKISKRIPAFLFNDSTSFFQKTINNAEHNVKYKIGKVTDTTILKQIKDGNYSGLEALLQYAKNDNSQIDSGTAPLKSSQAALLKQNTLTYHNYYYVYIELDTENGKYYPVEDVNLYQALESSNGELWLCDVGDDSFTWTIQEDTIWDLFVKTYKETVATDFKDMLPNVTITNTDNSMKVVTVVEGVTYETNFTYENGIVSLTPTNNTKNFLMEGIWVSNTINALSKIKGYDVQKVSEWLDVNRTFTLAKDGVEFTTVEWTEQETSDIGTSIVTGDRFTSYKLDIKNGLIGYNPNATNIPVKNPGTGAFIGSIIGLILLFIANIVFYNSIKRKNKFNNI